jgi:hypothetical protein
MCRTTTEIVRLIAADFKTSQLTWSIQSVSWACAATHQDLSISPASSMCRTTVSIGAITGAPSTVSK